MTVTQTVGEKVLRAWHSKRQNTDIDLYTEDLVCEDIVTNKVKTCLESIE